MNTTTVSPARAYTERLFAANRAAHAAEVKAAQDLIDAQTMAAYLASPSTYRITLPAMTDTMVRYAARTR